MPRPAERAGLAVDACGALNLAGAGVPLMTVGRALGVRMVVVEQVLAETLWIEDIVGGEPARLRVDLAAEVGAGLEVAALGGAELPAFVALAAELDDGEAATLAVALHRDLAVHTDDRKAARVAGRVEVPVIGTPTLLRRFSERAGLAEGQVADLLRRVERRASYTPRRGEPDHDWWLRHTRPP